MQYFSYAGISWPWLSNVYVVSEALEHSDGSQEVAAKLPANRKKIYLFFENSDVAKIFKTTTLIEQF